MEKIIVRGPYSQSGFGVACIGLIKVLKHSGYDVKFIPISTNKDQHMIGLSSDTKTELNDIIIKYNDDMIKDCTVIDVGSLIYALSVPKVQCKRSIIYCTTETVKIHPEYAYMLNNKFDEVWTATNFNKIGFETSGVSNTIRVVPHVIDIDKFSPTAKPLLIENKRSFNFVANFDFSYRKGLHILLPAYAETFTKNDDVSLTIKITNNNFNNKEAAIKPLNDLLFMLNFKEKEHAPILFMFDMLSDEYIAGLYTASNCYVAPTLAEGFGLPIAEAMACGIPPIVSRCSGPLDYVSRRTGYFIKLNEKNPLQPIHDESLLRRDPRYRGMQIYNIDGNSLEEELHNAYMNQEEVKEKGINARKQIENRLSINRVSDIVKSVLNTDAEELEL